MAGPQAPTEPPPQPQLDLSPYEGYWVALVRGQVAGIGRTAEAARRMARHARPREEPVVLLVQRVLRPDE